MKRLTILTASLLALWAAPALALDMEFYTYGGFNSVANAFKQVALILNDSGFTGLFYVVAVLGILFGGIAFFLRLVGGMRLDPISWTWPILVGMVIYVAMIVPKGSLTIYDPVLNRFETVADIPDGVVLVAGTLNKLERGLVDIIDTAAPPTAKYAQGAGGIGFTALKNIMAADIKNSYFKQSLGRYMEDCVLFEMTRPGTTLSLDTLVNNNTDYLPELAKAVNPAVYTVYFTAATPNGAAMTCTDAWTSLNAFMVDVNNYTSAIAATAGKTMFDPDNVAEVVQFRGLVTDTMQETTGLATTPEVMVRQGLITRVLFETLQGSDPVLAMTVQANRQATTSGIGMMVAANEWLPVVKAVLTTVAIGLIPVLLLFIPTPLLGKSLSILVGFFLFLASWGVTDAIVHNAALAAAADTMKEISQSGLALDACLSFPSASTKVLAMFGTIRSGGIMLASMLTMMLVSFGGHALSALAGNLTGQMQSAGVSAGALASPEGKAAATAGLLSAGITDAWHNSNRFDYRGAVASGVNARGADFGRGTGYGDVSRAVDSAHYASTKDTTGNLAARDLLDQQPGGVGQQLESHGNQQAQQLLGSIQGGQAFEEKFGKGSIARAAKLAAASAHTSNLAKGGSDGSVDNAMGRGWATGLMEVGKTDETIANFVNKEFGGNYELAGAAMAMVQNQQTLGSLDSAKAFAGEMNRQHPGLNMSDRAAMRMLGAANHMRFSGAAAYAAAETDKQGGPNQVTAENSGALVRAGETTTRSGIGQAQATEDKAKAIGSSVEAQQRGEHRNVGAHAIDSQKEADLLNKTFGGNKNWAPIQIGDRASYSLGADGKPTTAEVQKAGSSQVSKFDTSSDRTKNVVDQSNEYTGPMNKESFASPGGLVNLTKDSEGQVIQGSLDGTIKSERVDSGGAHNSSVIDPNSGQVASEMRVTGNKLTDNHNYREQFRGSQFKGDIPSSAIGDLTYELTGDQEAANKAQDVAGAGTSVIRQAKDLLLPSRGASGSARAPSSPAGTAGGGQSRTTTLPSTPGPVQSPSPAPSPQQLGGGLGQRTTQYAPGQGRATYSNYQGD